MLRKLLAFTLLVIPAPFSRAQNPPNTNAQPQPKEDTCVISGIVVRKDDSAPLKGAVVQLLETEDGEHTIAAKTAVDGRFELKNVPSGQYHLTVTRNGYYRTEYGQKKPGDPGATFSLRPGQKVTDLLFKLGRAGVITGHVFDEDGEPMPRTVVMAMRMVYENGHKELRPETPSQSNDLGEFRLYGLSPGRYYISAESPHWEHVVGEREFSGGDKSSGDKSYAKMYYPSATDPGRASVIIVKEGEEIPSIDFLMKEASVYRIRGKLVSLIPKVNVRQSWVQVLPRNQQNYSMYFGPQNSVRADGTFEIPEVAPGEYTITARLFDEGKSYSTQQDIDISASDIDGLLLSIGPGITIPGRILWDGTPGLAADQEFSVFLQSDTSRFWYGAGARVEENNQFMLKEVPDGVFKVNVSGVSKDCYIKEVRYGDSSLPDTELRLSKGGGGNLEITVSSRGAHIAGTVLSDENLPVPGVWVVAVPEEGKRKIERLYKSELSDQNGQFELRGLAPGRYKLFSWDSVEQGAWQDLDFLKEFEAKGELVEVQDGDAKQSELKLLHSNENSRSN
jgi:Carboxypeptidase regulatory-like domain